MKITWERLVNGNGWLYIGRHEGRVVANIYERIAVVLTMNGYRFDQGSVEAAKTDAEYRLANNAGIYRN